MDSSIIGISGTSTDVNSVSGIHGISNTAYNFNGLTSKVVCSTNPRNISSIVTVSVWVKTIMTIGNQFLVEKYNWEVIEKMIIE